MSTDKRTLRRQIRALRRQITDEQRCEWNRQINIQVKKKIEGKHFVLAYVANDGEVDLMPTLRSLAHEKRLVLPRCEQQGLSLWLVDHMQEQLVQGRYGIWEPDPAQCMEIVPGQVDVVLCPCVAVDMVGKRLGMGGGYYDRLLSRPDMSAPVIAVIYPIQYLTKIPADDWDCAVDSIICPL